MADVPRVVWMLWLQGWDDAPRLVKACRRSWEICNPDWTIHILDGRRVRQFVGDTSVLAAIGDPDLQPEACSDRIRVSLLAQHGGVWVDATTYCLKPLDEWLFDVLGSGFFAFYRPAPDRMISSWFLAAAPSNYLVSRWSEATARYRASRRTRDHYFWFHYLFGSEYERDVGFRAIYDNMPKISAAGPHYYLPQHDTLWADLGPSDRRVASGAIAPLLKLSHRLPAGDYPQNSVAEFLCRRLGL